MLPSRKVRPKSAGTVFRVQGFRGLGFRVLELGN